MRYFVGKINGKLISASLNSKTKKSGAYVLFLGKVRGDTVKKKKVKKIEYSSYSTMAEKLIGKIEKDIIKKYKLERIVIRHRLGKVKAGEIAMLVAVISSHRDQSLRAIKETIDKIKRNVPIWKREVYSDGSYKWN